MFNSPKELLKAYKEGFIGSYCDPEDIDKLLGELKHPLFGAAAFSLYGSGKGKLALPFKNLLKFDPGFGPSERQTTGDCFVSGTKVQMGDGSTKNIEDIQIGEYVITHNNRPKMVYELINKKPTQNIINHIEIKKYNKSISTTDDHKIVVFTDSGYDWVEAKDLKEGDLLVLPTGFQNNNQAYQKLYLSEYIKDLQYELHNGLIRVKNSKNTLVNQISLSDDLMWLFGIYAAEGGIDGDNKERITFNLHKKETDIKNRIIFLMREIFGAKCTEINRPEQNVTCVRCSNIVIARLFNAMVSGNQWSKKLSDLILRSHRYNKLSFLRGWIDGDGHIIINKRRKITSVSVSKDLINDISNILISLQIQHSIVNRKPRNTSKSAYQIDIYGEQVYKIFPELIYATKIKQPTKQNKLVCSIGLLAPVSKITREEYNDNVYCINVKDDHSFIANGIAVHNCVSHSTRNAVDVTRACEIIGGEREEFVARGATEGIYGSRGHGGQGMSCSIAARFVNQNGGILLRKKYDSIDLSVYDSSVGSRWGSRGIPPEVIKEAQKHQVKTISLVNTVEQARDAIANGYAISVCSGAGFSSRRDQHGIASRSGGWSHAMAWIGMDDTHEIYNETLFLVQNSWGVWNGGPKRHDQPDGSFWIRESVAASMLSGNGSWAFSDVDGFPPRKVQWTINKIF